MIIIVLVLLILLVLIFFQQSNLPVFDSLESLKSSPWSKYLLSVYDELPTEFPLDMGSFSVFHTDKLKDAGINLHFNYLYYLLCPSTEGALYRNMSLNHDAENTMWVYHEPPYKPFADNSLVEVAHCSGSLEATKETSIMWFYAAKGSGIYFNIGKTISFKDHLDAVTHFLKKDCKTDWYHGKECIELYDELFKEVAKEYDSIQFLNHDDMRCGNTAIEIISVKNLAGQYTCGTKDGTGAFKKGWNGSKDCICDNTQLCINCAS